MKTLLGKIALGISDLICKPTILWACNYKKHGKVYWCPWKVFALRREFAVEKAEKQLRGESKSECIVDLVVVTAIVCAVSAFFGRADFVAGALVVALFSGRLVFGPKR
jgi:hypothetical protein